MRVNYINNETRDFLGAQQNHVCCKKLKRLRKQRIAPLRPYVYTISMQIVTPLHTKITHHAGIITSM